MRFSPNLSSSIVLAAILGVVTAHDEKEEHLNQHQPVSKDLARKVSQMARSNSNANHCHVQTSKWHAERRDARRMKSYVGSYPSKLNTTDSPAAPPDLQKLHEVTKNGAKPHYDYIKDQVAVLAPEGITGPYYLGYGNQIRQNITEGQPGIPLLLDIGLVNIKTCEPFPNVMVDVWHANATGAYSGFTNAKAYGFVNAPPVTETRNGSRGLLGALTTEKSDQLTFLRGLWPTNENGIAEFSTILPGKYAGRAAHIHL